MSRILLTTTGAVASDIVIKELKKMNHYIVGCNMYPKEWIVDSLNVDSFYKIPPISNQIEYLEKIKEICKIEKIDFIFPMIDYEIDILIKEREWFDNNDIELIDTIEDEINIEDLIIREYNWNLIWKYIKTKKNQDISKVFYLYYKLELSIKDIAQELNVKESYIKNLIYRTLRELQNNFGNEGNRNDE